MAARTTMAELITLLRGYAEAGSADYTVAGGTYWTDDQLQQTLDGHRTDVYRNPLQVRATYNNGTAQYFDYYTDLRNLERADGGTVWRVEDSSGSLIGTANYTVNYDAGHLRFSSDQQGTAYWLTARVYDIDRAAADVWRRKAAHVANSGFDWKTDNHEVKRSQLRAQYLAMADSFAGQAQPSVNAWTRDDLN